MSYRVVQWGTGNVGRLALRGLLANPDLELVGLIVHDPSKAGRDAGELCGLGHVGVAATTDADAALALRPDCVAYFATGDLIGEDGDHNTGGILATGMRVLNAVPAVCPAPPGFLSALDLPLVTGRGLLA